MKQIIDNDDDFGFSAISAAEYEARITQAAQKAEYDASSLTADGYTKKLQELEKIIINMFYIKFFLERESSCVKLDEDTKEKINSFYKLN